jgi:hypothetical protein
VAPFVPVLLPAEVTATAAGSPAWPGELLDGQAEQHGAGVAVQACQTP